MTMANNPPAVVMKAFTWAYQELGLSRAEAAQILGISEQALEATSLVGFDVSSDESEVQVAFIRMYHLLYALSDGDTDSMLDWFSRHNPHLDTVPKVTCTNLAGITYVSDYLHSNYGDKPLDNLPFIASRQVEHHEPVPVVR